MEHLEKQHLNLWWLYILLGMETIMVICILFLDKGGMSFRELKELYFAPILGILFPFIVVYVITKNELIIKIDETGIKYSYWPFADKKFISWTAVDELYLRKYDALGEYGGWGLKHRLWFKFNDKAFILNDKNIGLQITLNNQRKVLFSTANAEELQLFLTNLKHQYRIGAIETDVRER